MLFFIEQDIVDGGSISTIKSVLSEMKSMLNTPIKAFSTEDSSQIPSSPPPSPVSEDGYSIPEGDVSGQFTRVMWKGNVLAARSKVKKIWHWVTVILHWEYTWNTLESSLFVGINSGPILCLLISNLYNTYFLCTNLINLVF